MAPPTSRALRSTNWRIRDTSDVGDGQTSPKPSQLQYTRQSTDYGKTIGRERVQQHDEPASRLPASPTRVYVGSLPYIAQRDDVAGLFKGAGLEVVNIDMAIDRFTNRNPGYCFVDLASPEEATKAVEVLTGTTVLTRPVHVKPCVQKHSDRRTGTQLQLTRWGTSMFSPVEHDPTSLLLPIHRRRRLIVSGMPKPANQHTSDAELRELFRGFAVEAVSKVKWPREDVRGTSKDVQYAFVDLESAEEAARAMQQLNGAECWGGKVRVGVAQRADGKVLEREHWRKEQDDLDPSV